jgi:transposase InsO family protein
LTTIERATTDNHFSYRRSADVAAVIAALGATHKFLRPHCPWQNGRVERYNRTLQTEWAYRQIFTIQQRSQRSPCPMARVLQQSTTPLSHRSPTPSNDRNLWMSLGEVA